MNSPDIRVCFLGDSYTLGTGDAAGLGWAGRAHAEARGRGIDLSSYNLGIRGQTGAEIAERAAAEISVRIDQRGYRRGVVIAFGANDVRLERPFDESVRALQGVLRWCAGQGYQAFVLGITPAVEPHIDEVRKQLSKRLAQAAADAAVPFMDIRSAVGDWSVWHEEALAGDGIHPNAGGYGLVAEAVIAWKPWQDWLIP
ncbi:MAG: GDSL-type esterase/lipase family protein [Caulobacteraceae bacterium]